MKGDAEKLAALLRDLTLKIVVRVGDSDQMFGSVTSRDITGELEKRGYQIDRHKIDLARPIRVLGDYDVSVHLHRDIDVNVRVKVRAEGREDEEYVGQEKKLAAAEAPPPADAAKSADTEKSPPADQDDKS
jgi:large subunit ribosomal protein L9